MDFLKREQVVGTIGIVGSSLEDGDTAYFDWIKNAGLVEIDKLINLTSNFLKYNK